VEPAQKWLGIGTTIYCQYHASCDVLCSLQLLYSLSTDVIVLGTASQLRQAASASVDSVEVAGVTLPVAPTLKSLGCHFRPATHVRRPRNCHSQVLQLPRSSDQACSPSAARVCGSDASVQLNQQSTRLLQLTTARSSAT